MSLSNMNKRINRKIHTGWRQKCKAVPQLLFILKQYSEKESKHWEIDDWWPFEEINQFRKAKKNLIYLLPMGMKIFTICYELYCISFWDICCSIWTVFGNLLTFQSRDIENSVVLNGLRFYWSTVKRRKVRNLQIFDELGLLDWYNKFLYLQKCSGSKNSFWSLQTET